MFTIKQVFGLHEGGTKFYQVYGITHERSGRSITVTHWGAEHPGASYVPRDYGQSKMVEGTRSDFSAALNAKRKRGYEFVAQKEEGIHSLSHLDERLQEVLKLDQRRIVMNTMTELYDAY